MVILCSFLYKSVLEYRILCETLSCLETVAVFILSILNLLKALPNQECYSYCKNETMITDKNSIIKNSTRLLFKNGYDSGDD